MNAVEIEEAVSTLAEASFNAAAFPYDFLQAFGLNDAGIRKLRSGDTNKSDLPGGVLQRNKNNIHLLACPPGEVAAAMDSLRTSPATIKQKARFILATDGQTIQAERFDDGEPLACDFKKLPDRFTFFLSLAGISTVKRIDENAFDIRATGRLNKLYVELLKENPAWDTDARRQDLNHFFARLIFCFFAEDTNIFTGGQLFTETVDQMTERNGSNVHEILAELFRAMDTKREDRATSDLRPWAMRFPYVNGNLFSGNTETPRFNQSARNYLLFVGNLDWKKINPDIFGSMIQAVADDEERGALGMHYTSVPNILKVLNPLFLDDLKAKLEEAGDSPIKLLNLRKRLARIRVFDPACGSGNFLVIAYIQMRKIEAEINRLRGEKDLKSAIPISNFRGIELRSFPAEIARLALIIAEFQCDVLYLGELFARDRVLPLIKENWIICGNALRLDWLTVCPPTGTGVKIESDGLFKEKLDQVEIDFENMGGETYICGNPPYVGDKKQTVDQKSDIEELFSPSTERWKSLDYIAGFFYKGVQLTTQGNGQVAFVSTNSICQGQQVNVLWPILLVGCEITSAHIGFKWSNLAAKNAGVTVIIVQLAAIGQKVLKNIYEVDAARAVDFISPYLTSQKSPLVGNASDPLNGLPPMTNGCAAKDGGNLILDHRSQVPNNDEIARSVVKPFWGSDEIISGLSRFCLWIEDGDVTSVSHSVFLQERIKAVGEMRRGSKKAATREWAKQPHRFVEIRRPHCDTVLALPSVATETRPYLTPALLHGDVVVSNLAFAIYDPSLCLFSLLSSKMHLVWVRTVCGQLETRVRYSNTLGWNTFPVPTLTDQNKADLTRCAEDILLAREAHFPATIADLYDPEAMDVKYPDLRAAHERNDETLERIYIGRRFRNDTERLEKLFELYTEMTARQGSMKALNRGGGKRKK